MLHVQIIKKKLLFVIFSLIFNSYSMCAIIMHPDTLSRFEPKCKKLVAVTLRGSLKFPSHNESFNNKIFDDDSQEYFM